MTTLIFESTGKIISSLTFTDYADFPDYVRNSFIGDYAGLQDCVTNGFITDYTDYPFLQITINSTGVFFRKLL